MTKYYDEDYRTRLVSIANKFRKIRRVSEIKQEIVAMRVNRDASWVSSVERGKIIMAPTDIPVFMKVLGITEEIQCPACQGYGFFKVEADNE